MAPISVFISHLVKPGKERECESVLKALVGEAHVVPGYEGTIFVYPHGKEHAHFLTILRFASEEGLAQWERSEARRSVLERLEKIVQAPATVQQF